ncbi:MAG: hypothetical protein H7Y06_04170 [Opitutaceae bacterium]|nr:hypothetical protein [Opitutaceae bacterium]
MRLPLFTALLLLPITTLSAQTSQSLWDAYRKDPDRHPTIPNNSYAGVFRGERPIPAAPVITNVRTLGAKGDGKSDDTAVFKAAIKETADKGGAVLIPAGTYVLSSHLVLPSRVVLRGEGPDKTILKFTKSLNGSVGSTLEGQSSAWSWTGGVIWIGPDDLFGPDGKIIKDSSRVQAWEYWRPGAELATVTAAAKRGDHQITVSRATGLSAGQLIVLTMENPSDASLLKHIAGHSAMDAYNWKSATWILPPNTPQFLWPVEIKAVQGNTVTLAQPLRLDIRPEWKAAVRAAGTYVSYAGVEDLAISLSAPMDHQHLKCSGWNGVLFQRAYNCWARNIRITGAENPLLFVAAKNCTAQGIKIEGPQMHHHTIAMRVMSHDNLVRDFDIRRMDKVWHGINIEWLSSGNVYSQGYMEKGTFDSHRALSFDLIRTDITLSNQANGPGGAGAAGPFIGARVAHWNIRIDPSISQGSQKYNGADYIFMPLTFPMGTFVGITGAPASNAAYATAPGEKGAVVADTGKEPSIKDLYAEQLKLRTGRTP